MNELNETGEPAGASTSTTPAVYIKAREAVERYGLSNSILYTWVRSGKVRKVGSSFNEADIAAAAADPRFQTRSARRKGKTANRYTGPRMARQQPQEGTNTNGNEQETAYHAAYAAGYIQRFIDEYAGGYGISAAPLSAGICRLLSGKTGG